MDFNPRPPRGERRVVSMSIAPSTLFQSTPPARGATHIAGSLLPWLSISIHAPRKGSDFAFQSHSQQIATISIHAPRKGSDRLENCIQIVKGISIHAPRKGSDAKRNGIPHICNYFNPRPPQGERPDVVAATGASQISIHAPRKGSDPDSIIALAP